MRYEVIAEQPSTTQRIVFGHQGPMYSVKDTRTGRIVSEISASGSREYMELRAQVLEEAHV